jgi:GNAT superfamily N-acetyltransferase
MIDIRPVTDRSSLRTFIELPYRKYRGHPHWVPPLRLSEWAQFDREKNPFYAVADMDLFTAWQGDRLVGRVAAIDDRRHNETHKDNVAAFGFFEAESPEAASALLGRVEQWAVAHGRTAVRGPLNPSLNYSAGLQITAFDTVPFLMMPCNPPEYQEFIERARYVKVKDLYCWLLDTEQAPEARLVALAERVQQRYKVVVRQWDQRQESSVTERIRAVYSEAWKDNWGFVPPTKDEFWHIVQDLRRIVVPDGALIAEVDGRPVGCAIALPDINEVLKPTNGRLFPLGLARLLLRRFIVTRCRTVIVGVIDEYRDKGVLPLLMFGLLKAARRHGIRWTECSWTLEDNFAVNLALSQGGATHYKTYRVYQKPVG